MSDNSKITTDQFKRDIPNYVGYLSQPVVSKSSVTEKISNTFGISTGANMEIKINQKYFFETGLGLSLHNFSRTSEVNYYSQQYTSNDIDFKVQPGSPMGFFEVPSPRPGDVFFNDSLETNNFSAIPSISPKVNLLYCDIPFKVGASFFNNKLIIKTGLVSSILLYSNYYKLGTKKTSSSSSLSRTTYIEESDNTGNNFNMFIFGFDFECNYLIISNLYITTSFRTYLKAMYKDEYQIAGPTKLNSMNIGLRYYLNRQL